MRSGVTQFERFRELSHGRVVRAVHVAVQKDWRSYGLLAVCVWWEAGSLRLGDAGLGCYGSDC